MKIFTQINSIKNLFATLLLLFVAQFGFGQTVANYSFSALGSSNITTPSGSIDSNITYTSATNSAGTATSFNGAAQELRLYNNTNTPFNGGSISVVANNGATITAIEFVTAATYIPTVKYSIGAATTTASDPNASLSGTTYTISGLSVTSSVKIRNANSSTLQLRLISIKVTYTPGTPAVVVPTVSTTTASSITVNGASSGGNVTADGGATVTARGVVYNTATAPTIANSVVTTGSGTGSYTSALSSLAVNTRYYYRAYATNSAGTGYGSESNFYTLANVPGTLVIGTQAPTTIQVSLNSGTQNSNPAITTYAIQETGGQYVQANGTLGATAVWQTAATWATVTVSGLANSTTYNFRTKARNGDLVETAFGTSVSGTTTAPVAPVVTPASPTGTYNAAFTYNIIASNTPTSYALSSGTLPTGLSLNTTTGQISGTPTQAGTFNVYFTASNSGGTSTPALIAITINQASQTITFGTLTAVTYGVAPFNLTGTASSGLTVSYASSNPLVATISGNTVTVVGTGSTTITASQAGNANYSAATNVPRTLTVNVKNLTISGLTANNKVQDGTTAATLTGTPSLNGVVVGDEANVTVTGTPTATFASAAPANGITVTVTGYSLTGSKATNYSLTQPTGLTANITALGVPTATAATGVLSDGFTANWNAVSGASSYVLDVYRVEPGANATDLFISEYLEGGTNANNKYIEIYNGTGASVDLSDYRLRLYANGASSPNNDVLLSGTLANGSTIVYRNSTNGDYTGTSVVNSAVNHNGDDAFALFKISTNSNVDIFGKIGNDPGTSWTGSGGYTTADKTLRRKSTVVGGVTVNPTGTGATAFTTLTTEWDMFNDGTISGLGSHTFDGGTTITYVVQNQNIGNVTSHNVTGLAPETTYHYVVRAVNGSITTANSNEINVTTLQAAVTWNGTSWSNGTGPTAALEAIIAGEFITGEDGEFTAKKLTLNSGSFTINSGDNITVVNGVINNMIAANFVVENNANLLQQGTANTNTGSITIKRNSAAIKRLDYTLWSSPVTGQGLYAFSPFTFASRFYTYNPANDNYVAFNGFSITGLNTDGVNGTDSNNAPFEIATGYLIRTRWDHPTAPSSWTGTFTGVPHSGNVSLTNLTTGKYYATGNPYPSTIDADQFITDNNIGDDPETPGDGLYFWRKTNNPNQATSPTSSYATYTTAGGAASGGDTLGIEPNGIIQVGEGFVVKTTSTSLSFNNNQRLANNDNQFLKTANIERNRIWLNLSDSTAMINQMMVAYMTGATQGIDAAIDGRYINDSPTALNSLVNNQEFTIQGRSLPFETSDIVPLAFKTATAGNYSIAINRVDGLFTDVSQKIYLKDNQTSAIHDLRAGAYAFASSAGTFNNRFELVYQTQLSTPIFTTDSVIIYNQDNGFVVNSGNANTNITTIKVFDIRGRMLLEKGNINSSQTTIDAGLSNQVLLVQITSEDGITITKKVIR